nr:MAG TPA: hypothetical protein [Caudoviricetes sp.]
MVSVTFGVAVVFKQYALYCLFSFRYRNGYIVSKCVGNVCETL